MGLGQKGVLNSAAVSNALKEGALNVKAAVAKWRAWKRNQRDVAECKAKISLLRARVVQLDAEAEAEKAKKAAAATAAEKAACAEEVRLAFTLDVAVARDRFVSP